MEIWNLVFMQSSLGEVRTKVDFDIAGDLPKKNIDTGMGLERIASILQGVDNMYEIDEVYPVLERAAEMTGKRYGTQSGHDAAHSHPDDVRLRVVADHIRSSLMLIGDGVTPGNEGRGYVLRRMLRRAVRSMRLLGFDEPSLPHLLPVSMERMRNSYPELEDGFDRISQIAYAEEEAFRRTLASGTTILDTAVAKTKAAGGAALAGAEAFQLHDTYGFPIDLTLEMAAEQGLEVDRDGFRALMQEQRDRAKADAKAKKAGHANTEVWRQFRESGATDFRAYVELTSEANIVGLVRDGERVEELEPGQRGQVVLDRTPFYAESGGQVADEGIITADGAHLKVIDVQRPVKGLVAHTVEVLRGPVRAGAEVIAEVDEEWRISACQAHSGTHVVHAALRQVLGPSALQSGSYNKPGYLRLDFAWNQALSPETRSEIEEVANLAVRKDLPVSAQYMSLPQAREWGALALFGETYDEQVRVIEIGGPWSRELCGGTHVQHSSQIGALTITGESSVGSGVRRVEAFVGMNALHHLAKERALVAELTELVKVQPGELKERIASLLARVKDAEREIEKMHQEQVMAQTGKLLDYTRDVRGIRVLTHDAGAAGADDLRTMALTCATASATRAPRSWPSPVWPRAVRRWWSPPTPLRASGGSRPAPWCGQRPRPSAEAEAARTTWPRAAARTRRRRARHSGASTPRSPRPLGEAPVTRSGVRIGVDVGSVRVGVAASDPSGLLATPVRTLARDTSETRQTWPSSGVSWPSSRPSRWSSACRGHSPATRVPPPWRRASMLGGWRCWWPPWRCGSWTSG